MGTFAFDENDLEQQFEQLVNEVQKCRLCPRMSESQRVLNHSSGNLSADLMFIGEAPGRLGADGTGIPFHGDKAGHNFETLLDQVGLNRYSLFITNSVLCNPRDDKGRNSPPTQVELGNCSEHLRSQIDLLNPSIVVTLGAKALNALNLIENHSYALRESVRNAYSWYGRLLIPAYHPGQRAMIHRSFAKQLSDYQFICEQVRRLNTGKRKSSGTMNEDVLAVVDLITRLKPEVSYFALHKLFYLIEWNSLKTRSRRLTQAYIIRQKDGPYCTDLHIQKLKRAFPDLSFSNRNGRLILCRRNRALFGENIDPSKPLKEEASALVQSIIDRYGDLDDNRLKTIVYMSSPMRQVLRAEKVNKANLFNSPILSI